jgi:SRSO17 transposase
VSVIGHADRAGPLRSYCVGLMAACGRKSVEPLAAVTAPDRVSAQHQSLLHFVNQAGWSDAAVLSKVREMVLPAIEGQGPIEAWIIDDTGIPKKGRHSVGVGRQYCGQVGKPDNCQVSVSLSLANRYASLPVAWRLYLPREWVEDAARRRKAGVPDELGFQTKPEIALEQLRWACAAGLPRAVVVMDPGYGNDAKLRAQTTGLGLRYVAGIQSSTTVWLPHGGPGTRGRRGEPVRVSVKQLALGLAKTAWRTIKWREGSAEWLSSRFARLRVRVGRRDAPEEWLLIEWPRGEEAPTKYWLSTLDPDISFQRLVDLAKLRWRIERDYQELKQEVGLGHYEGRGWRGLHHHATLCIAAYGFLICERQTIPPSGPASATIFQELAVPARYRPRGAAVAARTAHAELDRHHAPLSDRRARRYTVAMPVLRRAHPSQPASQKLLTQ